MGTLNITVKSFGPVEPQDRVIFLDVLRGFSMLAILFVNSTDNAGLFFPSILFSSPLDRLGYHLVYILGKGKFWPLFALLMGVGLAIQLERAEDRKVSIIPTYLRRLFFMVVIGILLLSLTIKVPQLVNLARAALPVLFLGYLLRRRPLCWLGAIIVILLAAQLSFGIWGAISGDHELLGPPDVSVEERAARIEEFKAHIEARDESPSRAELVRNWPNTETQRMWKTMFRIFTPKRMLQIWLKTPYIFFMLLGIFLWRLGVFRNVRTHRRSYVTLFAITLPIGLGSATILYWMQYSQRLTQFGLGEYPTLFSRIIAEPLFYAAVLGIVLTLISGTALLMQRRNGARVMRIFAPVGRMALTNYALQDILPALVFGEYFIGISRLKISFFAHAFLLFIIFGVQILFSMAWLRAYRFGPLEWLWRTLTYWKIQPMHSRRELREK